MRYRALDENGDYRFGNNEFDYIEGDEAVAQAIKTKILLFYGEWWEDIGQGIPMFQSIIGQTNVESIKKSASLLIEKRIKEVTEVASVDEVTTEVIGRSIKFKIRVTTTSGQQTYLEVNV